MNHTSRIMQYLLPYSILLALGSGCMFLPSKATITPIDSRGSEVSRATVSANGRPMGQGTTQLTTNSDEMSVTIDARPEYFVETFSLKANDKGNYRVPLRRDEIYALTIQDANQVMNRWITLNIAETSSNEWWSVIINAIGTQDMEMELMDEKSGFIRTAWKARSFGQHGIRRRFVGNKVTVAPLTWRFKYQVERTNNGRDWVPYDRGLKNELDIISEIRARIN
ncbi:MAG: hypothetical protein JKY56_03910 [Kofleriaceae bacterium]|nr:hypothetical protein [Kofleriaceae bacterium]